uniref:CD70 antigen n=2 Tax=Castor canadensis TaxID=51338 RepID=A0A8B7TQY4_CASCN|nr:CD70 antigen-like [Castor canadensis]
MAEEGACRVVPRLPWATILRAIVLLFLLGVTIYCCFCRQPPEQPGWDVAELHLNLTGPRQDSGLPWKAGPALGRSFLHGPELDNGQVRVHREGIYRLHIQVTLTNCSSAWTTTPRKDTLVVGICSPTTHSISLLRLNFGQGCIVSSQRLTPLARGDTLCTNLTLSLLPSQNADETFFGLQWVHP